MAQVDHVAYVKNIYALFLKQDIAGVIAALDPEIRWTEHVPTSVMPVGGTYKGHTEVLEFFKKVPATIDITKFEPIEYHGTGHVVVVYGQESGTVPKTKKTLTHNWVQIWHFGANGKPIRFEEFMDGSLLLASQ